MSLSSAPRLPQVAITARVAAASGSPSWEELFDISSGVKVPYDLKTVTKTIQGEELAATFPVGGDEASVSFQISPEKSGTRREGFDVLHSAHYSKGVVLFQVFNGARANGVKYHQHAFIVTKCEMTGQSNDVETYDVELKRTVYAGFSDVRNGTWSE